MSAHGEKASGAHSRAWPGSRLGAWLLGATILSACAPKFLLLPCLLGSNAVIAALFLWDRARLRRVQVALQRVAPARLRALSSSSYQLVLHTERGPRCRVRLGEHFVEGVEITPREHAALLSPDRPLVLDGSLRAARHGRFALTHVSLRKETRLGLCAVTDQLSCESALRVYPDLPMGRGTLRALERRDLGATPQRISSAGHGSELDALREYVPTDSLRSIDWKATAKRRRPITRAYQPERSQTVWIVLDASRAMTLPLERDAESEPVQAPTRFGAALEAALRLADTALDAGDRVGLLVYGHETRLSVLPGRGRAHLLLMVERLLAVQAEPSELYVAGLLSTLARLAPKRSFLVFFTDLDNEADLYALAEHARLLSRRHLTLCVSLRAQRLKRAAEGRVHADAQVYLKVAALTLLEQRHRLSRALEERGMPVVETDARGLSRESLKRYREIKRSARL